MRLTGLDAEGRPVGPVVEIPGVVRYVDTNAPQYQQGVDAANLMLNSGEGNKAAFWIEAGEIALGRAHRLEDVDAYHRLAGMVHTLREYVESQT